MISNEPQRDRFDLIDQEQLAAQLVAVMDAHLYRPDAASKVDILRRAERQIRDAEIIRELPPTSQAASPTPG